MNLEQATQKVKELASSHAGRFGASANFKFEEGTIHLNDSVQPTIVTNEESAADCTLKLSIDNFEKMMSGDLNPMMAFMTGKLKIEGDKGVAMKLSSLF